MFNDLLRWRREASTTDWDLLAKLANTSRGYLDQIAYGNRRPSPELATSIENGTRQFSSFEPVLREDLIFAPLKSKMVRSSVLHNICLTK